MAPKIKVCIVGAGVSGLRCAEVLLENDFDVTIYEARDRIGGRVKTMASLQLCRTGTNSRQVTQSNEMGPLEVDM